MGTSPQFHPLVRARRDFRRRARRGGALLAVLWLVAALSAIALTIAATVRNEVELSTIHSEGVRAYFLARAGIERAALWVQWGAGRSDAGPPPYYFQRGMRSIAFPFPSGEVVVDVIPEAAKLNINQVRPEELAALLVALGTTPLEAQQLAMAIDHWRQPARNVSPLDAFYLNRQPSFPARHSSLENVEELLLVQGMTPELFYGTFVPVGGPGAYEWETEPAGTEGNEEQQPAPGFRQAVEAGLPYRPLVWRGGLRDCVSVFGSLSAVDVNWAEPAVMLALGLPPQAVAAIVARRQVMPFRTEQDLQTMGLGRLPGMERLRVGGRTQFTLRATARLRQQDGRLSDVRRTAAAVVDLNEVSGDRPFTTLRWYDTAWKP